MRHPATILNEHGLYASKRRGQNYLAVESTAAAIVALAEITPRDTVVEIGAGLGALTWHLAKYAGKVIALEIDRGIHQVLQNELNSFANVEVRLADAMDFNWHEVSPPLKVVGNLPYAISSPLLFTLLENLDAWQSATLMLQKELAQRLSASEGSRQYGRLSVLLQSFCEIENKMIVGPDSFFPKPSVDSLVFTLTPRLTPLVPLVEYGWFNQVVKAAFANRRKTLLNSLSGSLPMEKVKVGQALEQAGIDPNSRAESLSISRLADMARQLYKFRITSCI